MITVGRELVMLAAREREFGHQPLIRCRHWAPLLSAQKHFGVTLAEVDCAEERSKPHSRLSQSSLP